MKCSISGKCAAFNFFAGMKSNLAQTEAPCSLAQEDEGKYPPSGRLPQAGNEGPKPNH